MQRDKDDPGQPSQIKMWKTEGMQQPGQADRKEAG
jgi:hypothetical protein